MLRFLVDECCEPRFVALLRTKGYDTRYVPDDTAGVDDQHVVGRAIAEGRLLLTDDKDFGEFVVRRGLAVPGVVLIRIDPADRETRLARVGELIDRHGWRLPGHYAVLDQHKIRFRRLPGR